MMSPTIWTLLLGSAVALLGAAPLVPAMRELRRGHSLPLHIPGDDDAGAEFFAQRMRLRLRSELGDEARYDRTALPAGWHNGGTVPLGGTHGRPDAPADTLIGARLRLAAGCRYYGDLVARDRVELAEGANVRAVLVEAGDAVLGDGASVLRWIDATSIEAGRGARLLGRATARGHVRLGNDSEFRRIGAPLIELGSAEARGPFVEAADFDLDAVTNARFIERPDEQGRWVCRGSLRIPRGVRVRGHLIVEGELEVEDHCEILGSVKAHRGARLGNGVRIHGSLFAGPVARLGADVSVHGMLSAETRLESGPGLSVGLPGMPASLLAPVMQVGRGSRVHGSVWAARSGRVAE